MAPAQAHGQSATRACATRSARTALIMAGGTGGHVFPALALAHVLQAQGWRVVWLGTAAGIEARLVPAQDIELETVAVAGLRGKGLGRALWGPFMVLWACVQSLGVMLRQRPDVVVGFGGFTGFPGGLMALLLLRPLILHEQNAVAGLTNRLLAPWAKRVFEGFPQAFRAPSDHPLTRWLRPPRAVQWVGNPVRADIAALDPPEQRFAGRQGVLQILVLGGSQGALALNTLIPRALALMPEAQRPRVRHQGGPNLMARLQAAYAEAAVQAELCPFIDDMAAAYGACDLVICRSGALTVAELAAAGVGSLLVPFPAAVDDHQRVNARFLEQAGAARVISQAQLAPEALAQWLGQLTRPVLLGMAQAARQMARLQAAEVMALSCAEVAA